MYTITINITGLNETLEQIEEIKKRANNLQPVLSEVAVVLRDNAEEIFKQQGFTGGSWPELKQLGPYRKTKTGKSSSRRMSYYERVLKAGDDPTIRLNRKARKIVRSPHLLINSLTKPSSRNAVLRITKNRLEYGTKVNYAASMQLGVKRLGVAKRPFLSWWYKNTGRAVTRMILRYVKIGQVSLPKSIGGRTY